MLRVKKFSKPSWLIYLLLLIPYSAFAHSHPVTDMSFVPGLLHPLSGLDHSLAMLAVGLLASQYKKSLAIILPISFLAFMFLGGWLGFLNYDFAWAELGIMLSVMCFGLIMTIQRIFPSVLLIILIFVFALCHGHAHGAEMLPQMNVLPYACGFLFATAGLHLLGYGLGLYLKGQSQWFFKITGLLFMVMGLMI